jgi:hypothetical protein
MGNEIAKPLLFFRRPDEGCTEQVWNNVRNPIEKP